MGEMADFALDEVWDDGSARLVYRTGRMPVAEAYDRGLVDELGGEIGPQYGAKIPAPKTCRCCGKTGLHWKKHRGGWRLFDHKKIHDCPVHPLATVTEKHRAAVLAELKAD